MFFKVLLCYLLRSIITAMGYKEGETMVSVLDFKREAGLWHSVLAVRVFPCLTVVTGQISRVK